MRDVLAEVGYLGLGSRLKRLAERLQSDASIIHTESGERMQPGQFPLIAALDRYGPLTVNEAVSALGISQPAVTRAIAELVSAGLATSTPSQDDRRQKQIALTDEGAQALVRMKRASWPRVEAAALEIFDGLEGGFLEQVGEIEKRLDARSLLDRVRANTLSIVPYSDELALAFRDINAEWIEDMFVLEDHDRHVLNHPREIILDPGGDILFVEDTELGVVGACALQPDTDGFTELTKMGVLKVARGRKAGEFLLRAVLERARALDMQDRLYLVTNWKCGSAIHLYEKVGFVHDEGIMARFGARYARCDVAMRYRPGGAVGGEP